MYWIINILQKKDSVKVDMFPVILKPVKLGSSIGVSIVKNQEELSYALDVAFLNLMMQL